jgi:hypothetical protein
MHLHRDKSGHAALLALILGVAMVLLMSPTPSLAVRLLRADVKEATSNSLTGRFQMYSLLDLKNGTAKGSMAHFLETGKNRLQHHSIAFSSTAEDFPICQ